MRKLLTITSLLLGLVMARAEVLLVEDFDYTIGNTLSKCGSWYLQFPDNTDPMTITGGLEMPNYAQSGVGNAVLIDCESSSAVPHLAFPHTVTSGCVYVAMMIQATLSVGKSGWLCSLRDNQITTTTYNENCRLLINEDNQLGACVAKPTQSVSGYDKIKRNGQQVYLVVLKYEIIAGGNNDETSLFVLDSVCAIEPTTPAVGPLLDSKVADIQPANILLRGFDGDAWIVIDGIRVATTWAEALGVDPTSVREVQNAECTMHNDCKILHNGRLLIQHQGRFWTALGEAIDR